MHFKNFEFKRSILSAALFSCSVVATTSVMASESFFAENYLEHQINLDNIHYVNTKTSSAIDLRNEVFKQLAQQKIILLDNTGSQHADEINNKLATILGVSVAAPLMLIYQHENEMYTHAINNSVDLESSDYQNINFDRLRDNLAAALAQLPIKNSVESVNKSLQSPSFSGINAFASASSTAAYRPGVTRKIRISENLSCRHAKELNHYPSNQLSGSADDCAANRAKVDLTMTLRLVSSLPGSNATEGKFFRVTINDTDGTGAGIHLSNQLRVKTIDYTSHVFRRYRMDPIIHSFTQEVSPVTNSDGVIIHRSFPQNPNPMNDYTETSGFTISAGASANAQVDGQGPKVGVGANVGFSINESRAIRYTQSEYSVRNFDNGKLAGFSYERSSDYCRYLTGDGGPCRKTSGAADSSPILNPALSPRVTPIAYSNFKPKFDFVFKAPRNKTGTTQFSIITNLRTASLFATRTLNVPIFFFAYNSLKSDVRTKRWSNQFVVDWGHPAFSVEPNVYIKAEGADNQCIDEANGRAISWTCHKGINQTWGLDGNMRYRSRVNPNQCLTVRSDNRIAIQQCGNSNSQRWRWNEAKLETLANGKEGYVLQLNNNNSALTVAPKLPDSASAAERRKQEWSPFFNNLR
ncbi:MAG: leukocidin family pore-forming toxin [Parashewanella sp.]